MSQMHEVLSYLDLGLVDTDKLDQIIKYFGTDGQYVAIILDIANAKFVGYRKMSNAEKAYR